MGWQPKKTCNNCIKLCICKKSRNRKRICDNYEPNLPLPPNHGSSVEKETYNMKEFKENMVAIKCPCGEPGEPGVPIQEINSMKCMRCGKEMRNTIGGNYICDSCGFAINDLVYRGQTATPSTILNPPVVDNNIVYPGDGDNPNYYFWGRQGWICPKCGASLAPDTSYCPFCAPGRNKSSISATGTTGDYINPNINKAVSSEKQ